MGGCSSAASEEGRIAFFQRAFFLRFCISGEDIPIAARCLAIADSFDAMTSKRSYKQALPVDFAIKEIEDQAGRQFDPRLAKVFVEEVRAGRIQVHPYVTENS